MSDLQIKELKESYEKEFRDLETAITDEKPSSSLTCGR